MKLPEINWDDIRGIIAQAELLHQSGKMDQDSWLGARERIWHRVARSLGDVRHIESLGIERVVCPIANSLV